MRTVAVERRTIALRTVALRAVAIKRRTIALGAVALRTRGGAGTFAALIIARRIGARSAFVAEHGLRGRGTRRFRHGLGRLSHASLRLCCGRRGDRFGCRRLRRTRFDRLCDRAGLSRSGSGGAGLSVTSLLLLQGHLDDASAAIEFFLTQPAGAAARWRGLRARWSTGRPAGLSGRSRARQIGLGRRTAGARSARRRRADTAFGFHHHGLRATVAEALLHRTGGHIAADTRLQSQRSAVTALLVIGLIVFGVAHAAC